MNKFTLKGFLPQLSKKLPKILLASAICSTLSANPLIEERSKQIVNAYTSGKGTFLDYSRVADRPGLASATQVVYKDASGQVQSLVMLPDGEHVIAGALVHIPLAANTHAAATALTQAQTLAPSAAVEPVTTTSIKSALEAAASAYDRNDSRLTIHDFRSDSHDMFESVFGDISPDNLVESYVKLLRRTNQISEGTAPDTVYVFYDPMCGFCAKEHRELRPHIDAGEFKVSFIPVQTVSKAPFNYLHGLVDDGLTNEQRVTRIKSLLTERPPQDKITINNREAAEKRISFNGAVMAILRSPRSPTHYSGTPVLLLEKANGDFHLFHGSGNVDNLLANL